MKFQINESEKKRIKDLYQINEQGMRGYLLRMLSDDEPQSYSKTVPSSSNVFPYDVLNRFGLGSKESLDFNSAPIPRLNNIINHIKKYEEFVPYTYDDAYYPPKKVQPGKSCKGRCTIGYGTTDPAKAKPGATVSESVASSWLTDFVEDECVPCIKRWQKDTKTKVTPPIFEALIDVIYNMGCRNFRNSTIAEKLQNNDAAGAGDIIRDSEKWGHEKRRKKLYDNFFSKGLS
jgi:GH24 family phage-related lysozyme (muramidase)